MAEQQFAGNGSAQQANLAELAALIRSWILRSTTAAGSGHPTSALSAVELMTTLFFKGHFRYDPKVPERVDNDRLIFSKGHASPLLYALWAAGGQVTEEELMTYRQFGSPFEGHPTRTFRLAEAATGSLGQGLSIGVGMAINAKYIDKLPYKTFVLLGDSEMAEGSQWEAQEIASHYKLDNLIGIIDVNRLGQRGETMYSHDTSVYERRCQAFGWNTIMVEDGHDLSQIDQAYTQALNAKDRPTMIIAKTIKGKGVSRLEGADGWHGKALDEDQLQEALNELPKVNPSARGTIALPATQATSTQEPRNRRISTVKDPEYSIGEAAATRDAYGSALVRLAPAYPALVALDGEVCNSTRAKSFRNEFPERFFEMYIAEQNMVGAALGLSLRGKYPFVSSFAAFLSRAADQIRMSAYSGATLSFVGSHAGVSIGKDGPSQMGLEDIAFFRAIFSNAVLYPCDAVSTERLVEEILESSGISYLRTTRGKTPVIYSNEERFPIGGSKTLHQSDRDIVTIVAAGITVHESLKAYEILTKSGIATRIIDCYSVEPLDKKTLCKAAEETKLILTVEDHRPAGGIGEAVASVVSSYGTPVVSLAVRRLPRSGSTEALLDDQQISCNAIVKQVQRLLSPENKDAPMHA